MRATNSQPTKKIYHSGLSRDREGIYPIHIPDYEGVDQLIVLSSKWIIVITTNLEEVVKKIDLLTDGNYGSFVTAWENSLTTQKPNWSILRNKIQPLQRKHLVEARELAGERLLDSPDYYTIKSNNDSFYENGRHPERVTRYIAPLGEGNISGRRQSGFHDIIYAHYSYLEMPEPLRNGRTYTVTLENGRQVNFIYDELRTISRAIKVNQVGYLPQIRENYAYLSAYLHEFGPHDFSDVDTFYVISATSGNVVHQGKVNLRAKNPKVAGIPSPGTEKPLMTGEDIYEMHLSGINETGYFFISIPGVGRSWTFYYGADAYGEPFYTLARGLYHQRSGFPIEKKYSAWDRPAFHTDPVYENDYIFAVPPIEKLKGEMFDVIGATTDTSRVNVDAKGGWYDAADWDKNLNHFTNLFDLLYAYQLASDHFTDGQLFIPESHNGIPDILDEAEYGLLVWKKSMTSEGGIAGALETWTHPRRDSQDVKYSFTQRTRWSSLLYAAAASKFAYLVSPFDATKAQEYEASALQAYAFGMNPKNSLDGVTVQAAKNRGTGEKYAIVFEENEKDLYPFMVQASTSLYVLTHDERYLDRVPEWLSKSPKPYDWPFSYRDFSPWLYYDAVFGKASDFIPKVQLMKWKQYYFNHADRLVSLSREQPYRLSWPPQQDYWMAWGATTMTNQARALLVAFHESSEEKYLETALNNIDYMLGANPLGMSWTTGLGYTYPIEIQHETSEVDKIMDPVPGIPIYGTTGVFPSNVKQKTWQAEKEGKFVDFMEKQNQNLPLWRRWAPHPHVNVGQNEFTIHETMSSGIFCYGMLIPPGWMPSQNLINKKPREKNYLFGFWYLP
ncbi:MAG: hypothetical protein Tsb0021_17380 [Chlamydiales bacterium]